MAVYRDMFDRKHNRIAVKDIILVGDCNYFDDTELADFDYSIHYMFYRGFEAKLTGRGLTKEEAIAKANEDYKNNLEFCDGSVPFELVVNLRGNLKWCVLSSNTITNDLKIEKLIGKRA